MDINELVSLPAQTSIVPNALLRDYTTFQLGGACPALIDCPDADALASAAQCLVAEGVEFMVIGQGSNLLVSDKGLDLVVLRYCTEDPAAEFDGLRVRVSGSTLFDDLARLAIEQGVGDLSFCSGIPGTVGGAIAGNAGAFGRQIGDVVESVDLLAPDGSRHEVQGAELGFEYRSSVLKQTGAVVLNAVLKLETCDIETMTAERERIMELRRTKHPNWRASPCAGSVFRNVEPTSAADRRQAAGWFLEEAGAKNFHVGGARLFEKHANIIVADPEATAQDVFALTEKMIAAVRERFGFELEREIKLLGEF
ncbi:UDP-N-acetylmuramate dehydrogenase [Pontiella sulfatireligans]|uniref:UDP-N-acetylenolpyruvoylglucosamine reductase n=1 Tax=Pontiella sulfatireligans TaxID=2750658 RepID=A0A6C2UIV5_9BACT|nr:UDP-N-acetylmuramate dehydrogenase [Pontiella sulfatireligans]VGO20152.1 UDP-N-acetylenolpyruvoylglucosamine reductase [Pontiella sulfatireligans]